MQGQSITNIGGLVIAETYKINDANLTTTAVNYTDEQMVPKRVVSELISSAIASGGGQDSILSSGGNTTLTVQDSPS